MISLLKLLLLLLGFQISRLFTVDDEVVDLAVMVLLVAVFQLLTLL